MYKFLIHVVINTIFLIEQQKENWEKYFKTRSQLLLLIKLVTVKKKMLFSPKDIRVIEKLRVRLFLKIKFIIVLLWVQE